MKKNIFLILFPLISFSVKAQVIFGQDEHGNSLKNITNNYSNPKEFIIADLQIVGTKFLDGNALLSLSGLKVGDKVKIPGEKFNNAIKKLWKQGIIDNIGIKATKVEDNKIWLELEILERSRMSSFIISGVNKTKREEIEDKIKLVKGKILTDIIIKNTKKQVKNYLTGKGFINAKIDIYSIKDTKIGNNVILKIDIKKGKRIKIKNIIFEGNKSVSSAKLKSKMKKTGERSLLQLPSRIFKTMLRLLNPVNLVHFLTHKDTNDSIKFIDKINKYAKPNIFKAKKLIKSEYENDKKLLIDYYLSQGYRDAKIVYDSIKTLDERSLEIKIKIDEGQKYYFRNISWKGNFIYATPTLEKILGIKKGDIYDLENLNKKLNYDPTGIDISSLYLDNGYLFFNIRPIEINVTEDSIDVEMRIYEGEQATINEVTISGNFRTNDYVIMRELRTRPGDKFSRANLIRTQRELAQLGYFDPQTINQDILPNPVTKTVDIKWKLEEKSSDQFELSAGWGGGNLGFIGSVGISFNNFSLKKLITFKSFPPMGDGQKLSFRVQANGLSFQSYSVNFTQPWLGGKKPNSLGLSFSYSVQRNLTTQLETSSSLDALGFTVSLGRRLKWPDDFFILSNALSYYKYTLFQYGNRLGFSDGDANNITFRTTLARSSSDNPAFPQRGSEYSLSVSFTPPYSLFNNIDYENDPPEIKYKWIEYHKWAFDIKYYQKIVDKLVINPRIHFGFIGSYPNTPIGPFERFVLGGDGLSGQSFLLGTDVIGLRGYPNPQTQLSQSNSVTPFDSESNFFGGTLFVKYVMELRYAVSLSPTATIYILSFAEFGNNWNEVDIFNPYDLKRSAGVGIRILMPAFGLLGLDYGYGFDPPFGADTPSGSQFHFSIGQQIR